MPYTLCTSIHTVLCIYNADDLSRDVIEISSFKTAILE